VATIRHVVSVHAPVSKVWRLWSTFENLAEHFEAIENVRFEGDLPIITFKNLIGRDRELQISITESVPDRTLAFKANASELAGSLSFEAAGQHTFVTFVLSFDPPAARLGDIVSNLLNYPSAQIRDGLQSYHEAMERK
jgi:uncharacterized membrane protein